MIKKFEEFIEESYGNRTPNEISEIDNQQLDILKVLQTDNHINIMMLN